MKLNEKPFSTQLEPLSVGIKEYLGENVFLTDTGEKLELRGFTTDLDRIAMKIFETKFVSVQEAYQQAQEYVGTIEQQMQSLEHTRTTVYVPKDTGLRYRYYGGQDIRMQAILPSAKIPKYAQTEET